MKNIKEVINMAGYVKGSNEWYNIMKERILFLGDLMMSPLTSREEKEKCHIEQTALLMKIFEYCERQHTD